MNTNTRTLPRRHRYTAEEYRRMGEAGICSEDNRMELIEGEIIDMAPIGNQHAGLVNRLNRMFMQAAGNQAIISVQNSIRLADQSEPQPGIAVLKLRSDDYRAALPTPSDVLLVVEVADVSLDYDRTVKVPLYARHDIPEVWLVDPAGGAVEVFREPSPEGYRGARRHGPGARRRPSRVSKTEVDLEELLR
jgi:Uma2 family endonuclease